MAAWISLPCAVCKKEVTIRTKDPEDEVARCKKHENWHFCASCGEWFPPPSARTTPFRCEKCRVATKWCSCGVRFFSHSEDKCEKCHNPQVAKIRQDLLEVTDRLPIDQSPENGNGAEWRGSASLFRQ